MAFLDSFKVEQGHLVRKRTQPERELILRENQAIQSGDGGLRNLSFAGLALRIPDLDLIQLRQKYPELNSPDPEIRTRAWRRFMASSESDPYRVHHRRRARANAAVSLTPTTTDRGH